ncbi:protein COFACTOR ASSEMBLY OF COMPLEX C SUBUNIT B CCB2, chloroplastic isoform X1 [Iris pallida]|uniref:Protein COFACTOR ASSEMBLY OF COMPLEX C SUBUNIT B CCB2, chloroplastic isoform X1 n=1 Tax=Iris pallida TaxID=29817 RepID=A0AAX6HAS9_IRIPA|nr:protein COFACTOR ASSEMBLY OF COMPLEX C SUBUNIT B CCB2, chloroplastic isoform X1 [Iris pallida]
MSPLYMVVYPKDFFLRCIRKTSNQKIPNDGTGREIALDRNPRGPSSSQIPHQHSENQHHKDCAKAPQLRSRLRAGIRLPAAARPLRPPLHSRQAEYRGSTSRISPNGSASRSAPSSCSTTSSPLRLRAQPSLERRLWAFAWLRSRPRCRTWGSFSRVQIELIGHLYQKESNKYLSFLRISQFFKRRIWLGAHMCFCKIQTLYQCL